MIKEDKNVQCPNCGARLKISVKVGSDPTRLGITCPVCKIKTPLSGYKSLDPAPSPMAPPKPPMPPHYGPQGPKTVLAGNQINATQYMNAANNMMQQDFQPGGGATVMAPGFGAPQTPNIEDKTVFDPKPIASLQTPAGESFQLREGDNVVGRKAASSTASIQIDMGTLKRMGREHLRINVLGSADTSYCFEASLVKEKCNYTAVNGCEMKFGDRVFLRHGDRISLPDMELTFLLP